MKDTEPVILFDPKPEGLELALRLICGAILGMFLALSAWLRLAPIEIAWTFGLFATSVATCAWAAARYGDHFWHKLAGWLCRYLFWL
jgi:hypothetical protein